MEVQQQLPPPPSHLRGARTRRRRMATDKIQPTADVVVLVPILEEKRQQQQQQQGDEKGRFFSGGTTTTARHRGLPTSALQQQQQQHQLTIRGNTGENNYYSVNAAGPWGSNNSNKNNGGQQQNAQFQQQQQQQQQQQNAQFQQQQQHTPFQQNNQYHHHTNSRASLLFLRHYVEFLALFLCTYVVYLMVPRGWRQAHCGPCGGMPRKRYCKSATSSRSQKSKLFLRNSLAASVPSQGISVDLKRSHSIPPTNISSSSISRNHIKNISNRLLRQQQRPFQQPQQQHHQRQSQQLSARFTWQQEQLQQQLWAARRRNNNNNNNHSSAVVVGEAEATTSSTFSSSSSTIQDSVLRAVEEQRQRGGGGVASSSSSSSPRGVGSSSAIDDDDDDNSTNSGNSSQSSPILVRTVRGDDAEEEDDDYDDIVSGTSAQAGTGTITSAITSIDLSAERGIVDQVERERHALRATYAYGDDGRYQQEPRQSPPPPTTTTTLSQYSHNTTATASLRQSPNYRMSRFSMATDEAAVVMHKTPSPAAHIKKQQQQQHQRPFTIYGDNDHNNINKSYHAAASAEARATNIMISSNSQDAATSAISIDDTRNNSGISGCDGSGSISTYPRSTLLPMLPPRYTPGEPSPYHPGIPHGVPEEGIWRESLRRLSSRGVRLTAHGVQCEPRRIWLRFLVDQVSLTWQTEFPKHVVAHNSDNNDLSASSSSSRIVIVRGAIHHILMFNVLYVEVGKQTAALARTSATQVPEQMCLSLLTLQGSLDLQCNSRLERDALVSALGFLLDHVQIGLNTNGTAKDWRQRYIENSTNFALASSPSTPVDVSAITTPARAGTSRDDAMAVTPRAGTLGISNGKEQQHQNALLLARGVTTGSDTTSIRDNSSSRDDVDNDDQFGEDRSSVVALASTVAMPSATVSSSSTTTSVRKAAIPLQQQSGFSSPVDADDDDNNIIGSISNSDVNYDIASDLAISPTKKKPNNSLSRSRIIPESSIPPASDF